MDAELVQKLRVWLYQRGIKVDASQVGAALVEIDTDALRSNANERVTWELWDKESPINDASAEYVKTRKDYVDGTVYLVLVDGQVVVMQPIIPGAEGLTAMTDETAQTYAEQMRGVLVEDEYFKLLGHAVQGVLQ